MACNNSFAGGWTLDIKFSSCLCKDLIGCFYSALNSLNGATYKIILYLGSQVVNGINYCLICKQYTATNPVEENLVAVTINKSPDNVCTVTSITTII